MCRMPYRGTTLHHLYPAFIPITSRAGWSWRQPEPHKLYLVHYCSKTTEYLKMFLVLENLRANLCCSSWMRPEETFSARWWEGLCTIHSSESGSLCCVCPPPAARQRPVSFPPIVLSLRGELDYTNLEVVRPQPHGRASCRFSGLCIFVNGSQGFRSGYDIALHLFL